MNFQSLINDCQSPVDNDFIWMVEYNDGTIVHEFDLETKQQKSFDQIEQSKIIRFGLIGKGMKFYYEKPSGIFKLAGQMIEASLKTTNYEFYLTGMVDNSDAFYSNKANTVILEDGSTVDKIYQYSFGYTTDLDINGFKINFKVICVVEFGKPITLKFEAINDKETDGLVRIRKNREIVQESYMILNSGVTNEYSWELK